MHHAVGAFRYVNLVAYVGLGVVALLQWRLRRNPPAMWLAASFGALGLLEILSLIPNHPGNLVERAVGRVDVALLVLFPYLLFRFTSAFLPAGHRLANGLSLLTGTLVVWSFAMPKYPESGERRPGYFVAFVVVFLVHWTVLSILAARRLWRAGSAEPGVARRRMRLLALASTAITLAIFLAAVTTDTRSGLALAVQIVGFASVLGFYLGLAPPPLVRAWWRAPEQRRMQAAIESLLTFATSQEEVAGRVLEPAAAIVGARAIALRDDEGRIVGSWQVPPEVRASIEQPGGAPRVWPDAEVVEVEIPAASLVVWTSPYAPFFGVDELAQLRTLGALTGLALDRVRLFQAEHESRLALERANEVKTSFVALAAHELRTPMTTIHGFVTTLHHLSDRLSEEQIEQVQTGLIQQTQRMALLIEQLLDLSRLDANAIDIAPEEVRVKPQIEEIVAHAAPDPSAVQIQADADAVVVVDRNALERIVTNLVTNAFRYGAPPVLVRAEQSDRHFRLTVEDRGHGVKAEFVPDLFERFTRSESSRAHVVGTGLGLAIARSYAQAHGGDLLYEDAQPHGARFQLVLPAQRPGHRDAGAASEPT